jgi:hypothetical protein
MTGQRPTQKQIQDAKKAERQVEIDQAVADGRLVIRRMTPAEREQSEARVAAAAKRPRRPRRAG